MKSNITISRSVLFVPGIWTSERKMKKTPWKNILTDHGYSVDIIYGWYATHYHEHHKSIVAEIIDWITKHPNGIIIAHSFVVFGLFSKSFLFLFSE